MKVFRYENQDKRSVSGQKIGLIASFFIIIAIVVFFFVFDPSNFAALMFIGLIIVGMIFFIVIWLRRAQKADSVYVLDDQGVLWRLFMQAEASAHLSRGILLRVRGLYKDFEATEKQQVLNQDNAFIIGVVKLCQEEPQIKKTFYQSGSIIKELHSPRVVSSDSSAFTVQFIDEKGEQKETTIYQKYAGLEQALKNNSF